MKTKPIFLAAVALFFQRGDGGFPRVSHLATATAYPVRRVAPPRLLALLPARHHSPPRLAPPQTAKPARKVTLESALRGIRVPAAIRRNLAVVPVPYWSFDHRRHQGYLIVHKDLVADVAAIFREIAQKRFPIARMTPLSKYGWSDTTSMERNNTSAFNYRPVPGKNHRSQHAYGRAIDINPRWNPYERREGILPVGATYNPSVPGTIRAGSIVVQAFTRRGWQWGGRWHPYHDWQHFQKKAAQP